jgi:hypothetical protein
LDLEFDECRQSNPWVLDEVVTDWPSSPAGAYKFPAIIRYRTDEQLLHYSWLVCNKGRASRLRVRDRASARLHRRWGRSRRADEEEAAWIGTASPRRLEGRSCVWRSRAMVRTSQASESQATRDVPSGLGDRHAALIWSRAAEGSLQSSCTEFFSTLQPSYTELFSSLQPSCTEFFSVKWSTKA